MMKSWPIVSSVAVGMFASHLAFAADPTKQQCIDADTQSQSLRSAGKFSSTRDQLQICSSAACPQVVRDDCVQRIDEVNRVQPTIVFSAKNGAGRDLVDVSVTMDGQPLTSKLDGHGLAVDPGDHTFVFTTPGAEPVTQHFVLAESEKNRRETVVMSQAPATPLGTGTTANEPGAQGEPNDGKTQRILGLVVAGVGVVGIGAGTIFGLSASSKWSSAQNECSNASCPTSTRGQAENDRSSALTSSTISTIGFIGGGVLVAGGAVLFFTAPKAHKDTSVGLTPSLGGAMIRGTF